MNEDDSTDIIGESDISNDEQVDDSLDEDGDINVDITVDDGNNEGFQRRRGPRKLLTRNRLVNCIDAAFE